MAEIKFHLGDRLAINRAWGALAKFYSMRAHDISTDFTVACRQMRKLAQSTTDARGMVLKHWLDGTKHKTCHTATLYRLPAPSRMLFMLGGEFVGMERDRLDPGLVRKVEIGERIYMEARDRQNNSTIMEDRRIITQDHGL